ncbi:MAG TPA: hypothetical protein VK601_13280, partial [Kofleriaceae bacterium]|nr:hypothetical protein [Kofleriaceae bacterium]
MTSRAAAPIVPLLWAIALVCAGPRGAAADDAAARARADALLAEGTAAMARDDAATAAARYRAAWDLAPEARIALNLGIALAELGRTAAAAEAFAVYLADPACDPAKRAVIEQHVQRWRPELGEIALEVSPASAVVEIDGARPLRSAPGTRVPVAPGGHRVTARAAGYRSGEVELVVAPRDRATARLALIAAPVAEPAPPVGDRGARVEPRPWKWIALGAGLAAAAAGGYFGVTAIDGWRQVDDRCPRGACTEPADLGLAADARRAGTRAD